MEGWKATKATNCPDTEMWMKYFEPKKGERSIGTGKGVGIVDGSLEEVAAWVTDFCSNDRMRIHREEGESARLELKEKARENERTFATVKKVPFPLHNRKFVTRMIWKLKKGKVLVGMESVDDDVDYGVQLDGTRGLVRAIWQIEDLPVGGA